MKESKARDDAALLKLLYLSSPARPTGAFAWSGGLSTFVDRNLANDGESLLRHLRDLTDLSLCLCDLPLLKRTFLCAAKKDLDGLFRWNSVSLAIRETGEFCLEEIEIGGATVRLMEALGFETGFSKGEDRPPLGRVAAEGLFASLLGLGEESVASLLASSLWSRLENQVLVAAKCVPLGQSEAQRVLLELMGDVPGAVRRSMALEDSELGSSLPMLAIMSSAHEESPARMYRS
ncbi:MAG: urease accessory protein UreF [Deltaproteobacteria bacterium]|jgi:urease accessory protein|nr:urease accessory protein UreF [Deltaproteobacteria bacterium]